MKASPALHLRSAARRLGRWLGRLGGTELIEATPATVLAWCSQRLESTGLRLTFEDDHAWITLASGVQLAYSDKYNSVTDVLLRQGTYETAEEALLRANLPRDAVVFDVGANVGFYSLAAAQAAPDGVVHAFEPLPDTCEDFRLNLRRNSWAKNIRLIPAAVGEQSGTVHLTTEFHSSNYVTSAQSTEATTAVPCITLDDYAAQADLTRLDFIKIDVEGGELEVLRGASGTLRRFRPLLMVEIVETPTVFFARRGSRRNDVLALLLEHGYQHDIVDDEGRVWPETSIQQGRFQRSYHNYFFHHGTLRRPPARARPGSG